MRVAIGYYGALRPFTTKVYKSHIENLHNVLISENIQFDVYMHSWSSGKLINFIHNWDNPLQTNIEDHNLFQTTYTQFDDQDAFYNTISNDPILFPHGENTFHGTRNCVFAMESQKRLVDMISNTKIHYDSIILLRPDTVIMSKIDTNYLQNLKYKEIVIAWNGNICEGNVVLAHPSVIKLYSHRLYDRELLTNYVIKHIGIQPEGYLTIILNYYESISEIIITRIPEPDWICRWGIIREWDIVTENPWNIKWNAAPTSEIIARM